MEENIDEPEIIKAKKIRRAFLLKVDSELTADSKKKYKSQNKFKNN